LRAFALFLLAVFCIFLISLFRLKSVNFLDNPHYDSIEGCANWAVDTLTTHERDKREYLYSFENFEQAGTHDDLWNAAQVQMVTEGFMHVWTSCKAYMATTWLLNLLFPADSIYSIAELIVS
jgi:hypothetical protein